VKALRIGFLGVRTDRVAETTAFFRDVVGLGAVATSESRTVTRLPTGKWDFVEVESGLFRRRLVLRARTGWKHLRLPAGAGLATSRQWCQETRLGQCSGMTPEEPHPR
jgi:hypothetical protein